MAFWDRWSSNVLSHSRGPTVEDVFAKVNAAISAALAEIEAKPLMCPTVQSST